MTDDNRPTSLAEVGLQRGEGDPDVRDQHESQQARDRDATEAAALAEAFESNPERMHQLIDDRNPAAMRAIAAGQRNYQRQNKER